MTVVRKKSEVPELNQAKLGLVKLRQSCWSNLKIVVSDQLTNLSFGTVSKLYKEIFEKQAKLLKGWSEYPTRTTKDMSQIHII